MLESEPVELIEANRHDSKLVEATVRSIPVGRPKATRKHPQGLCLDKGYDYDSVRDWVTELGYTAHIKARGEEAQAIKGQRYEVLPV